MSVSTCLELEGIAVRRSLTAKFVETAPGPKDGADRVLYWDASAPGFGLMIMGGGRRSWVFQYRHAGKSRADSFLVEAHCYNRKDHKQGQEVSVEDKAGEYPEGKKSTVRKGERPKKKQHLSQRDF